MDGFEGIGKDLRAGMLRHETNTSDPYLQEWAVLRACLHRTPSAEIEHMTHA